MLTPQVYTCTKFTGYWGVGTAAVIYAQSQEQAAELLNFTLQQLELPGDAKPEDMTPFPGMGRSNTQQVKILCDGNY